MKKIVKIIIFISIFCIIWHHVFYVLWLPANNITHFYNEKENSLDIIYVGSSTVQHHFNPLLAYELYGFTTNLLSTGIQPFIGIKYLIEEAEKTQKPELYIIDISRIEDDFVEQFSDEWSREVIDQMKFSSTKINAINEILGYANVEKNKYINYYFSYFLYHNSWKTINENIFARKSDLYKGYFFYSPSHEINPQVEYRWNDEIVTLPPENKRVLLELIDYIKTNNLNVLFVIPKSTFGITGSGKLNSAVSIIEENNLDIINFNKIDNLNIDYSTDFYDMLHLNVYGATKYTLYFSKYLAGHYNLKNHKKEKEYASWDEEYSKFKLAFQEMTGNDYDEILEDYYYLYN